MSCGLPFRFQFPFFCFLCFLCNQGLGMLANIGSTILQFSFSISFCPELQWYISPIYLLIRSIFVLNFLLFEVIIYTESGLRTSSKTVASNQSNGLTSLYRLTSLDEGTVLFQNTVMFK